MGCATHSDGLRMKVERRIEALLEELAELPDEYAPEAYERWLEIQDGLEGLYDVKRRFLDRPPPEEHPDDNEELLY